MSKDKGRLKTEGKKGNILFSPPINQIYISPFTLLKANKSDDFKNKTLVAFHSYTSKQFLELSHLSVSALICRLADYNFSKRAHTEKSLGAGWLSWL